MTRKFKTRCNNCGASILMVQSTSGWTPLDLPKESGNGDWIRHNCQQSEDFVEWLSKKMGWDKGGEF